MTRSRTGPKMPEIGDCNGIALRSRMSDRSLDGCLLLASDLGPGQLAEVQFCVFFLGDPLLSSPSSNPKLERRDRRGAFFFCDWQRSLNSRDCKPHHERRCTGYFAGQTVVLGLGRVGSVDLEILGPDGKAAMRPMPGPCTAQNRRRTKV